MNQSLLERSFKFCFSGSDLYDHSIQVGENTNRPLRLTQRSSLNRGENYSGWEETNSGFLTTIGLIQGDHLIQCCLIQIWLYSLCNWNLARAFSNAWQTPWLPCHLENIVLWEILTNIHSTIKNLNILNVLTIFFIAFAEFMTEENSQM